MRARYGLTPRRACELDGSQHTSGAKAFAHAPPVGGDLGVGLGWRPATPALLCRRRGGSGGNAQGSGWRDGPRRFDGDARRKHAHGQSRRSATLTLLDVPLHVWRGAVRCYGRVAPSRPEQRNNVARSSEGQPFTTGMNAWPGLSEACAGPNMATCGTTSPQTPTITFDRRIDGHCCSAVDALRRRL